MKTIVCTTCGQELPFYEFYKRSDGRKVSSCKSCIRKREAEKYRENHQTDRVYSTTIKKVNEINGEIWKSVKDEKKIIYASSFGRIAKMGSDGCLYLYSQSRDKCGYLMVEIKGGKECLVHRIIAKAFISNIPQGMEINHKDGNKENNRVENLEIVSHFENMQHAKNVLKVKFCVKSMSGSLHPSSKSVACFDKNGNELKRFGSIGEAAREMALDKANISAVCNNKNHCYSCGGYFWKFV